MMTKNHNHERDQIEMITIDQLVPQDHLVRKLESAIDFSFIYPLVEPLYSTLGRPSIDPVVLIKMTFIQYGFDSRLMRQTIKETVVKVNIKFIIMDITSVSTVVQLKINYYTHRYGITDQKDITNRGIFVQHAIIVINQWKVIMENGNFALYATMKLKLLNKVYYFKVIANGENIALCYFY